MTWFGREESVGERRLRHVAEGLAEARRADAEMARIVRGATHLADRWRDYQLSPHNINWDSLVDCDEANTSRRRKVCIYGAGLGREEAPLDDQAWEVWALNLVAPIDREHRLRADRWFDLHQRIAQTQDDLRWIADCPFPIYLPEDLQDASAQAVRYPLAEIETKFGVNYWACTFAFQIALALYEGIATDLGLYGVELAWGTDRERSVEWANTAYWIGRAMERGVRIHTPAKTTLRTHPARYGLEYVAELDAVKDYTRKISEHDVWRRMAKRQDGMGG